MAQPIRSPELEELRAFCAAVDLGSLGRAARLFGISQPALSKRLRSLEAVAGAQLLERSSRGVIATAAGRRLYPEARKVLSGVEAVEELLGRLGQEDAPVRLAASHTIAEFVLPEPLVEFEVNRTRTSVELVVANSTTVRSLVADGRAQLGVAAVNPDDSDEERLTQEPYCDDEVIVGVPAGHPWVEREEIGLDEFVTTPLITHDPGANTRRTVEAKLAGLDLALAPPKAELGSTVAALAAAQRERAPVLASALAIDTGTSLSARRVAGVRFPRRFCLVLGAVGTLPPSARQLAEHLKTSSPQRCERDGSEAPDP